MFEEINLGVVIFEKYDKINNSLYNIVDTLKKNGNSISFCALLSGTINSKKKYDFKMSILFHIDPKRYKSFELITFTLPPSDKDFSMKTQSGGKEVFLNTSFSNHNMTILDDLSFISLCNTFSNVPIVENGSYELLLSVKKSEENEAYLPLTSWPFFVE